MKQILLLMIMIFLSLTAMRTCGESIGYSENTQLISMREKSNRIEQQLATMRRGLETMLAQLKNRPDFGEFGMQKVLALIDTEIKIVELLWDGDRGYVVQKKVDCRNKALRRTAPSVVRLYDTVLDLATMHANLQTHLQACAAKHNRLWSALNRNDRISFLSNMFDTLDYYYSMIQNMQYKLAKG